MDTAEICGDMGTEWYGWMGSFVSAISAMDMATAASDRLYILQTGWVRAGWRLLGVGNGNLSCTGMRPRFLVAMQQLSIGGATATMYGALAIAALVQSSVKYYRREIYMVLEGSLSQ